MTTSRESNEPILLLEGPKFTFSDSLTIAGHKIAVVRGEGADVANTLWDAVREVHTDDHVDVDTQSVVLAKYLESRRGLGEDGDVVGKRVLELGAGTGLAGIAAALLGELSVRSWKVVDVLVLW